MLAVSVNCLCGHAVHDKYLAIECFIALEVVLIYLRTESQDLFEVVRYSMIYDPRGIQQVATSY